MVLVSRLPPLLRVKLGSGLTEFVNKQEDMRDL